MRRRILITGVSGLLGNNLAYYFKEKNQVIGLYFKHPVTIPGVETRCLNLLDYPETRALAINLCPDAVIHCASRTDVDQLESDKEDGWQANVLTTHVLLDALRGLDAKLIHISTDSVYSGAKGPYDEEMETAPLNWYGKTKLESEASVSRRPESLILRTNLYGWNIQQKMSLAEWFLDRLQAGQPTMGFADAHFSSIYTMLLAEIIEKCIKRNLKGLYNCACRDSWTKYEFGQKIAEVLGLDPEEVLPTSLDDAGFKAKRGKDLRLDVGRLETELGEPLPTMSESLVRMQQDWKRGLSSEIKRGAGGELKAFYPERNVINYGGQAIDQADIDAVVKVLKSPYLTQGPEVSRFEEEIASYVEVKFAVAVSSGTAALHLACLAAGIGPGNEGITSPITFLASANAVAYCGATPCFADIDPRTYNMDAAELEKCISKRTRVVIPVHFAGQSCAMREIREVVSKKEKLYNHKIFIIEDASHAFGSLYRDGKVGCCEYANAAVFSFHPVKHITTGEGGMVVTNNRDLAEKIRKLRSHGMTKDPESFVNRDLAFSTNHSPNPWYYEQNELGFNYRITDIQCALGSAQLKKLSVFRDRRRKIVEKYNEAFGSIQHLTAPFESSDCESNFHLYVLKINFDALGISRIKLMNQLKTEGIHTQVHYIPVNLQPYYQKHFGTGTGDCPEAEEGYYSQCLSLPLYPAMSDQDVEKVIKQIRSMVGGNQ